MTDSGEDETARSVRCACPDNGNGPCAEHAEFDGRCSYCARQGRCDHSGVATAESVRCGCGLRWSWHKGTDCEGAAERFEMKYEGST